MKNMSSMKSLGSSESPKTPGGISKSLLTPCRRVGLSRKWKKSSVSPFVSPLTASPCTPEVEQVIKKESRKRKERVNEEEREMELSIDTTPVVKTNSLLNNDEKKKNKSKDIPDLPGTPSRLTVEVPRKKKSKTLLSALNKMEQNIENVNLVCSVTENIKTKEELLSNNEEISNNCKSTDMYDVNIENEEFKISKPVKNKSISKKSLSSKPRETNKVNLGNNLPSNASATSSDKCTENKLKETSPKELTKECIVVIQKKIFKTDKTEGKDNIKEQNVNSNPKISQDILDSDCDDVPLCQISKKEETIKENPTKIDDDNEFSSCSKGKAKVKKLVDKKTSTGDLKADVKKKKELKFYKDAKQMKPLQMSFDDDDDDDFDFSSKKTIIIKKTYNKVEKPLKAKSTGSITLKDIDDLKARIEMKKKMLLAKAMTEDTAELRGLIKKWQKGCQDALVELMDLMKMKFPDKQFTDYSEILQMLKIPAPLVGYDSDNDCFNTPDDATILLSKFNE